MKNLVKGSPLSQRIRILALLCLLLVVSPSFAGATGIPVVDILAWAQRFYAQYQRAEQIARQAQQVRLAAKSIQSFGQGGSWSTLHGLLGQIDELFRISGNLGYLRADVEETFRETFPGYAPPESSWPEQYKTQAERAHETLALLMAA